MTNWKETKHTNPDGSVVTIYTAEGTETRAILAFLFTK